MADKIIKHLAGISAVVGGIGYVVSVLNHAPAPLLAAAAFWALLYAKKVS